MTVNGVWFPTIRTGTGTDVFTERLVEGLRREGLRAQIEWLPHHAEFMPWAVSRPKKPEWANVVHVNSWLPEKFIPKEAPFVCTVHSIVHASEIRRYKSAAQAIYHQHWIHRCERISINKAAAVTAISHHVANQVRSDFGRMPEVVLNWIDTELFVPPSTKLPNEKFQVLYVGTARALKGVQLLPALAKELGQKFEVVATVEKKQMQKLGLDTENLRCVGRITGDRLRALYGNSDVLIFPSRAEGFGLVALEAQACGLPVVATRGSAIPEVVEDGVTGLLCNIDEVISFADAVRKLESNLDLRRSMGAAGRARAKSKFSEARAIKSYSEIYTAIANDALRPT